MSRLKLSDGGETIVDTSDYKFLSQWKWRKNSQGYVRRSIPNGEFLHRVLLNAPADKLVDHINRNPLDNRKSNLRLCTASENNVNQKRRKDNKSGHRGVSWYSTPKKWAADIKYNDKRHFIGLFSHIEEAIGARLTAELEYFGEFTSE
jgi:hypothetical protein